MVINGGEVFALRDGQNQIIDGPTPSNVTASNSRAVRSATNANTWVQSVAADADPGVVNLTPTGAGLILTEFSDPVGAFEEAFVEIYYDAQVPPQPELVGGWVIR